MRGCSALAILGALLLWVSTPALACIVAPAQMTAAEMQCCRDMADHCGDSAMANHSCCAKTPAKVATEKKTVMAPAEQPTVIAPMLVSHDVALVPRLAVFEVTDTATHVAFESPPGSPLPLKI